MLISTQHQKVVLNLRDPNRVTTVIPTAQVIDYKGKPLVAVPHRPDETRVLWNLGIKAPAPIRHHYGWPGTYTPTPQQITTAELITMYHRCYVLNDMGTGKTMSALWAYDYLRQIGVLHKVIVVAPLSTLDLTWANTVFRQFFHLNAVVLHGSRHKRLRLLEEDVDIYIVNHDGLRAGGLVEAVEERDDIDMVVVDELGTVRNAQTEMWKALNRICNPKSGVPERRIVGMTGTPIPNAPTDAYAQCKLVTPATVPRAFRNFRDATMRQVAAFKWEPKPDAVEIVRAAMTPAVRFTLDECVDLPPLVYETRQVSLTPEQEPVYKAMANKMKAECEGAQITAINEADRASKLVQIACGAAYTVDGGTLLMPGGQRVEELRTIIEQSSGKVIVFVPYIEALKSVAEQVNDFGVEIVYGEVSKSERDRIFAQFEKPNAVGARVLVAHPKTMSHGLTLVAATTIVWFAPTTSNDIYQQANARIRRPGQPKPTAVIHLAGTPVERKLYSRLEQKQSTQGALLEAI